MTQPKLENWYTVGQPGIGKTSLVGDVFGNPHFKSGSNITTSVIPGLSNGNCHAFREGDKVKTMNTEYLLGKPMLFEAEEIPEPDPFTELQSGCPWLYSHFPNQTKQIHCKVTQRIR